MTHSPDIICRYVRIADVPAYCQLGWEPDGSGPLHAPHGLYSVMMTWMGKGEPVEPPKVHKVVSTAWWDPL